jgi:hypothetical protein
MSGWVLLVLLWVLALPGLAVMLGRAIRTAEHHDWVRRGRPERRSRPRTGDDDPGPSLRRARAPEHSRTAH